MKTLKAIWECSLKTLKAIWNGLSPETGTMKKLQLIGGALVPIISAVWAVFVHFSEKEDSPSASTSIGIPLAKYKEDLEAKNREIIREQQKRLEDEERYLLEKEYADTQRKLKNPEGSLVAFKGILVQAYKALEDFASNIPPKRIKQAQDGLTKGQTVEAEKIFLQVLTWGKEKNAAARDRESAAKAAYQLGKLAFGRIDYQAANSYYNQAVDLQWNNPRYLDAAGLIAYKLGQYASAEPLYKRALTIREETLGPDHLDVAISLTNLGDLYLYSEPRPKYDKIELLYERALTIREKALGPDHPDLAASLGSLAELYDDQNQYAKAESLCQRALAIREKALGSDHPDVAESLSNLAVIYAKQRKYWEAEPRYQQALAILENALGPSHPDVATSLTNLATLYYSQRNYALAEPFYKRALEIREKVFGPNHPKVASSLDDLARLYYKQGQYKKAESLLERTIKIQKKILGPDSPDVAVSLDNLGVLYKDKGWYDRSEPLFERALMIWEKTLGPSHPAVIARRDNLARVYRAQGKNAEAEKLETRVK